MFTFLTVELLAHGDLVVILAPSDGRHGMPRHPALQAHTGATAWFDMSAAVADDVPQPRTTVSSSNARASRFLDALRLLFSSGAERAFSDEPSKCRA